MLDAFLEFHLTLEPGPRRALGLVKFAAGVGLMCLLMGSSVGRGVALYAEYAPDFAMDALVVVLFIPLLTGPIEVFFGRSFAELRRPEHAEGWHPPVLFLLFGASVFGSLFIATALMY